MEIQKNNRQLLATNSILITEVSPPESSSMIVVGESFTDEGIPMRHVHHREFPEIRGEGETIKQSFTQLTQQLDRALEYAREAWHRDAIERAIQDVKTYHHASLKAQTSDETAAAGTGHVREQHVRGTQQPLDMVFHRR